MKEVGKYTFTLLTSEVDSIKTKNEKLCILSFNSWISGVLWSGCLFYLKNFRNLFLGISIFSLEDARGFLLTIKDSLETHKDGY